LIIDKEHSHIEAGVKSSMDNFSANLTAYEAVISVDPAEKRVASAQLKFPFAAIKTGNEKRDTEMRHWQQVDQFPECVYILEALLPAAGGTFNARGKFILHGVTKDITFPVTIGFKDNGICTIDGDLPLDTRDFSLPIIRNFAILKVNPLLQVKFHLEGRASTGA
jgi:polyisoprenoid-binding protein YceI